MPRQAKLNTTEKRIVTAFTNLVNRRRLNPTTVIKTVTTNTTTKTFNPTKEEITRWVKSVNTHRRVVTSIGDSGRLTVFTLKGFTQRQRHGRTLANKRA